MNPRPVSGEIMTGADMAPAGARPLRQADILDAEFVTIDPPDRADVPHRAARFADPVSAGIGMLRGNDPLPAVPGAGRGGAAFWLVGLLLAAGAFWVSGGHALIDAAPLSLATAKEPLRIASVRSRVETHGGRAVLFVDTEITNRGRQARAVPPLSIDVAARSGRVARYNLGTSAGPIAANGSFVFSSRFAAPMDGVETVSVSFRED